MRDIKNLFSAFIHSAAMFNRLKSFGPGALVSLISKVCKGGHLPLPLSRCRGPHKVRPYNDFNIGLYSTNKNDESLNSIREYIMYNPSTWDKDKNNLMHTADGKQISS